METRSLAKLAPLDVELDDEIEVRLRPVGPTDVDRVTLALKKLSRETFRNRFSHFSPDGQLAEYICNGWRDGHMTWLALDPMDVNYTGFGGASLWRDSEVKTQAEFSITIADEWQRRGLAGLLFSALWTEGWHQGIRRIVGYSRLSNVAIFNWWSGLGGTIEVDTNCVQLAFDLVSPEDFIQRVGFNMHANDRQFELASWLQYWEGVLEAQEASG